MFKEVVRCIMSNECGRREGLRGRRCCSRIFWKVRMFGYE